MTITLRCSSGSVARAVCRSRARSRALALVVAVGAKDLLGRRRAASAQMIERDVARQPQQPARERHAVILVLDDDRDQLHEDLLREVLGLLVVAHDAADVAIDVVRVAHVQEPQRVAIALLGASDRQANLARRLRRLVERPAAAKARLSIRDISAGEHRVLPRAPVRVFRGGMISAQTRIHNGPMFVTCVQAMNARAATLPM